MRQNDNHTTTSVSVSFQDRRAMVRMRNLPISLLMVGFTYGIIIHENVIFHKLNEITIDLRLAIDPLLPGGILYTMMS